MSTRALTIAGVVLLGWAVVHSGHHGFWSRRVVVAGPGIHNVDWHDDWNDDRIDAALDRLDALDDIDVDVDNGSVHIGVDGAHPVNGAERERLRAEIREQIAQARQEAWRARGEFREEMGRFRDERHRVRNEIRNNMRANRDAIRNSIRETIRQSIREPLRETFRHHHHDDDIY